MSDILERAKAAAKSLDYCPDFADEQQIILELIAEVEAKNDKIAHDAITIQMHHNNALTLQKEIERLRSENARAERAHESLDYMRRHEIAAKAARIRELGSEIERLRSEREVWIKHYNDVLEANARIKELEAEAQEYHDKKEEALTLCAGQNRYIERLEAAFLEAKRCPTCNGKGMIRHTVMHRVKDRMEDMSFNQTCPLCSGKGEQKAREALEKIRAGGKDESRTT